jgi:hypothetical protein
MHSRKPHPCSTDATASNKNKRGCHLRLRTAARTRYPANARKSSFAGFSEKSFRQRGQILREPFHPALGGDGMISSPKRAAARINSLMSASSSFFFNRLHKGIDGFAGNLQPRSDFNGCLSFSEPNQNPQFPATKRFCQSSLQNFATVSRAMFASLA